VIGLLSRRPFSSPGRIAGSWDLGRLAHLGKSE